MPLDGLEGLGPRLRSPGAGAGDATVWVVRLDLEANALARLDAILAPDERARAARLQRPVDRARFIAARAQLRQLLGARIGSEPAEIRFHRSPSGKPALAAGTRGSRLRFNASASEGIALVALRDDAEVGVDVEAVRALTDTDALASRLLSSEEARDYRRLPAADRERRFFEYWVRKEAVAKSLGAGLKVGLDRLGLHPWRAAGPIRVDVLAGKDARSQWLMPLTLPEAGFAGAIASSEPLGAVELRCWPARA